MRNITNRLAVVAKVIAAVLVCACMCACGNRNESEKARESGRDSVAHEDNHSVDWEKVEPAERVSEPADNVQAQENEVGRRLTVLDFSATWCGPCRGFAPVFHEVSEEYKDQADFRTIDIDQERAVAEKYNIQAVPTIVVLDEEGKELRRVEGAMTKSDLIELIKGLQ